MDTLKVVSKLDAVYQEAACVRAAAPPRLQPREHAAQVPLQAHVAQHPQKDGQTRVVG
jgi:hypothetical protein